MYHVAQQEAEDDLYSVVLQVYLFDPSSSIIVMQLLGPPNVILRHAIVKGEVYPHVGRHVGVFLANTLFNTSLLAMDTHKFRWGLLLQLYS